MQGGEIFIPKLPSIRIYDLVKSLDEKINIKIVGKKPGEKIHESLFSSDEASNIDEYSNFFILKPTILITSKVKSFSKINEKKIKNSKFKDLDYNSKVSLDLSKNVMQKVKKIFEN
jgi:UDP-N-acetylglucosamine 4,6-dehydratase